MKLTLPLAGLAAAILLHAPAASAQPAESAGRGAQGAALCMVAGEHLAARPGAGAAVSEAVAAWRQILNVVEPDGAAAEAALARVRGSLAEMERTWAGLAATMAEAAWPGCAPRERQVGYLKRFTNGNRAWTALAAEPGTVLPQEVAERLGEAAACAAIAAAFAEPDSALRAHIEAATPRVSGAEALAAIREQARGELDAVPGPAAGKALLVDYLRATLELDGERAQGRVDAMSAFIQQNCLPEDES